MSWDVLTDPAVQLLDVADGDLEFGLRLRVLCFESRYPSGQLGNAPFQRGNQDHCRVGNDLGKNMEDRQTLVDGLVQLRANAGIGNWIVEPDIVSGFDVFELVDDGDKIWIAGATEEDVADFIATTHAVIPELVEEFMGALDEADRLDAEKDDLHGEIFRLETELDDRDLTIGRLVDENGDLNDEISSLEDEVSSLYERICELESELWARPAAEL